MNPYLKKTICLKNVTAVGQCTYLPVYLSPSPTVTALLKSNCRVWALCGLYTAFFASIMYSPGKKKTRLFPCKYYVSHLDLYLRYTIHLWVGSANCSVLMIVVLMEGMRWWSACRWSAQPAPSQGQSDPQAWEALINWITGGICPKNIRHSTDDFRIFL